MEGCVLRDSRSHCCHVSQQQAELADPEKMKQREAKFGKALVATHDPKDPEVLKKRAEKFGAALGAPKVNKPKPEEEARKKVRGCGWLVGEGLRLFAGWSLDVTCD